MCITSQRATRGAKAADMFEHRTTAERLEFAKAKMTKVLDHFLYVVELHANNAFVVYSPTLVSQIPPSFAANAFNVLQRSMHQIEIVRLCALWDTADSDKENIPTVIAYGSKAIASGTWWSSRWTWAFGAAGIMESCLARTHAFPPGLSVPPAWGRLFKPF
jgi:hypothetical protein